MRAAVVCIAGELVPALVGDHVQMTVAEINRAARQAWVGFWHSCMRSAGAKSCLPFDPVIVARVLNGQEKAPEPPPPEPLPEPRQQSALAKLLEGDERISDITLGDVLAGLEDYFKIFRQMKKQHPGAYDYFSRVGAPLCLEHSAIWSQMLDANAAPIVNPHDLPAYIGLFLPRSREKARDDLLNDKPSFLDFQLYEKRRRNIAVVAPWKWITYDHAEFSLERDVLTRQERRRIKWGYGAWGLHYFIGIDNVTGEVGALPMQMDRIQTLPTGRQIHHSQFMVPPGLKNMAAETKQKLTVDQMVALLFACIRGFTAAALSGVQLSIRKGNETARFGIPISYMRSFFKDRDREGARRRPMMHFVGEYKYQRGNRQITVGEHLRGARRFTWRGYQIVVSAPGIHHPAPETLTAEPLHDDDILQVPESTGTVPIAQVAGIMRQKIEKAPHVPFRKGQPTAHYRTASLSAG